MSANIIKVVRHGSGASEHWIFDFDSIGEQGLAGELVWGHPQKGGIWETVREDAEIENTILNDTPMSGDTTFYTYIPDIISVVNPNLFFGLLQIVTTNTVAFTPLFFTDISEMKTKKTYYFRSKNLIGL